MSMEAKALEIEQVPIGRLLPDPGNVRTHPPRALESLKAAIVRFGWRVPIVANRKTGLVEAGHLRLQAAQELGQEFVPVIWVEDDAVTASSFALSENRLTELSGYDQPALLSALDALRAEDALDDAVGWAQEELDRLRAEVAKDQARGEDFDVEEAMAQAEEDAPELICRVKRGQVWGCGQHRVMCGDATSAEDVGRLMAGRRAQAVVTDPPYGIEREGIANDDPGGLRLLYDRALRRLPADDAVVIAFQSPRLFPVWLDAVRAAGHKFERMLWMYRTGQGAYPWRGWYMRSDAILVSTVGSPQWPDYPAANTDCYEVNIADRESVKATPVGGDSEHSTVKPIDTVCDLMQHTCGIVLDPFLGSGTTLIAAEKTGRVCMGTEISEKYCAVALARFEAYTGSQAILLEDTDG